MRLCITGILFVLGMGCATRDAGFVKTQVITFPEGGIVEYNGKVLGRAPAAVVLPQDEHGRLTQRAVVRATPNEKQDQLFAQAKVFEPGERTERVPNRVMIDLRLPGTNQEPTAVKEPAVAKAPALVESPRGKLARPKVSKR